MLESKEKKKIRKFLYSPLTLIFLGLILMVLVRAGWGVYHKERVSKENLERQKVELEKLALREENLAQSINYLKSEEGVEAEIRSKFRLAKEGESVAVIIDNEAPTTTTSQATISTISAGFWGKLLNWWRN